MFKGIPGSFLHGKINQSNKNLCAEVSNLKMTMQLQWSTRSTLLTGEAIKQNHVAGIRQFSIECSKANTKVIISTSHSRCKQRNEPIQIRSNSMYLAQSAGKIAHASHNWIWFSFSLADRLARNFLTNH